MSVSVVSNHMYTTAIVDKKTGGITDFLVLKDAEKALWLSVLKVLELADGFLGEKSLKLVFRDPKVANDIKGIEAQDARGAEFKRVGKNIVVNTFLMTYGEQWRDEFTFKLDADLFDSHLKVAANKKVVDELLAKERGPKVIASFGD